MRQIVETEATKESLLMVMQEPSPFMRALRKKIEEYDMVIHTAETIPFQFKELDYMFVAQDSFTRGELASIFSARIKILIITTLESTFHEIADMIKDNGTTHVRVVYASLGESDPHVVERVLWFMLSHSSETSLHMGTHLDEKPAPKKRAPRIRPKLTRRRLIRAGIFSLFFMHVFFIIPLIVSTFLIYRAGMLLRDQRIPQAQSTTQWAQTSFQLTKGAYALAHPGLQFFSLAILPSNIIALEENALVFIDTTLKATVNARRVAALILQPHKDIQEIQETRQRIADLEGQVAALETASQNVYDRLTYTIGPLEKVREDFLAISTHLASGSKLISHLDTILADNTERDYIFFFYNNMEIRPGGGFIGSFAHVTFADYTLASFDVFDVYDADGQLKTHVRPPAPIRDILEQPHWFLRDSNFSPDFEQNVKNAEFFLDRELQITDFDGALGMTTTALTYVLEAFGDVHIPDFNETINADNFYLNAQSQAESNFFPGSKRKKSFLSTVGRQLMLKMESADPALLGIGIKRALDEKHIVLFSKDPAVQADIDSLGWGGKILNPQCVSSSGECILNHILPVDANLGVNKANFFVNKRMKLTTTFEPQGRVRNELSVAFTNTSPPEVFPGGTYKNYLQLYIPHDAVLLGLDIDGVPRDVYDISTTGLFKIVGTLVVIEPKETVVATLTYRLKEPMKKGKNTYQVVFQKQIGSFNSDFSLELAFPPGVTITNQNFKSVAKNQSVLYNSSLSTNKIFVIDFVKE